METTYGFWFIFDFQVGIFSILDVFLYVFPKELYGQPAVIILWKKELGEDIVLNGPGRQQA